MAKRRDLELAFLAALVAAVPGCAGKPIMPWSKSTSSSPSSLDELTAKNNAANKPSWTERFAMKPKVIQAQDATSLSSKPGKMSADVFISAARIHEGRGNFEEAEKQYKRALESDAKDTTAIIGLARLNDRQMKFPEAEKLYRQAAQIDPKSALVWNDLGLCYARQKRLDDAIKTLDYAVKLQPANKMYRNNMATVLVEAGRHDEAWAQLTALNEPAVAHYNMGYLLHQRKQTDLAIQHFQLSVEADPSLKPAEQMLSMLQGRSGTTEELVVEAPSDNSSNEPVTSYTISDTPAAQPAYEESAPEQVMIANSGSQELVNPLAPSTRRAATFRMPPTEEQENDPAPSPSRLPATEDAPAQYPATSAEDAGSPDEPQLDLGNPGGFYPSRRISYEDDGLQQPKNIIKLLGVEDAMPAPLPE